MWQPGWQRGFGGRIDTYLCMDETLCCSPVTITTLLIGYALIKKKKVLKKRVLKQRSLGRSNLEQLWMILLRVQRELRVDTNQKSLGQKPCFHKGNPRVVSIIHEVRFHGAWRGSQLPVSSGNRAAHFSYKKGCNSDPMNTEVL